MRHEGLGENHQGRRERILQTVASAEPLLRSVWNVYLSAERLMTTMKFPRWTVGAAWVGEHAPDAGALGWQAKFQVGGDEG